MDLSTQLFAIVVASMPFGGKIRPKTSCSAKEVSIRLRSFVFMADREP